MIYLLFLPLVSFAYEFGSNSRPLPVDGNEFSKSAVTYESVDWRPWLGPVRNQSNCGSCVAFATVSTIEDQLTINSGALWKKEAFSQEALFSAGRSKCSSGWFALDAVKTVEKFGVLDVACAPYRAGATGKVPTYGTFCEEQDLRTLKIKSWKAHNGAASVKEALKKGPLMTTMVARAGFDTYSGGIYKSTMYDEVLGGHAVELVGFDDIGRYWIIKNSWGDLWGEKGHARISYDDAQGVAAETYSFEFYTDEGGFELPKDHEFVSGKVLVKGDLEEVQLMGTSLVCAGSCVLELADGEYVLKTTSKMGRVLTRRFTVMNSMPGFKWKLAAPAGYNYSYPQEKRIYFNLSFEDVLPEFIHMEIKKGSQSVFSRNFTDVLKSNRLGFNTTTLPNGAYEVFFRVSALGKDSQTQSLKILIRNL